jgi:EAL domain-containing protein (putative c-di-GMP-specific phosphodiesterase class I)
MKSALLETLLNPKLLSVCFQPIFRLQNGAKQVDSLEALIRGPKGTHFERADILFDYVRRKKAEAEVDRSCVIAICDAVAELPSHFRVNINAHASTLGKNSSFVDFFRREVRRRSLAFDRFTVEIVEYAPTCNVPDLLRSVASLRDMGIRLALDDIGLGQSNYRMMLDCNPDYFKLDAYFVRDLKKDLRRRAVVESVVTLAKAMNGAIVGEGVGTEEDLEQLEDMGIDLIQSNLLCEALPFDDLRARLPWADPALRPMSAQPEQQYLQATGSM